MTDDTIGSAGLLEWGERLAIAFYSDLAEKAGFVDRLRVLAEPRVTHEVRRGEDALPFIGEDALIVVDPENEEATVRFFDQNRDHFDDDATRVLIPLLLGGSGERALQNAPALASFARDASFEIVSPPTHDEARASFAERHGMTPEEWLRLWRAGTIEDTLETNLVLSDALAIADSS